MDSGWSNPAGFIWIALTRQQLSHLATYAAISFFIFVHQNQVFKSWYILLLPEWMDSLEEWASSKIWFLSSLSFGTTSRSLNHRTPFSSNWNCLLSSSFIFLLIWNIPTSVFWSSMIFDYRVQLIVILCRTVGCNKLKPSSNKELQWYFRLKASTTTLAFHGW